MELKNIIKELIKIQTNLSTEKNDIKAILGGVYDLNELILTLSNPPNKVDSVCDCQFVDVGFCPYCKVGGICELKLKQD